MPTENIEEKIGFKRSRLSPVTSGITPRNKVEVIPTDTSTDVIISSTSLADLDLVPVHTPRTPLPSLRKSALNSPPTSISSSVKSNTPVTPVLVSTTMTINGTQGGSRFAKWSSLLCDTLMQERKEEEKTHIAALASRIASSIPGDRAASADTFRVLLVNLKDVKNNKLREDIIEGRLPVEVLVHMKERDLLNPEARKNQEAEFLERSKDTDLTEIRKATTTRSTLFVCPSCKARDCTWTQRQTRSGDEPMTVFCFCNVCEHKWRRY